MKWIKASERLPETPGKYLFRTVDGYHTDTCYIVVFIEKKHIKEHIKAVQNPEAHEWLDETESAPAAALPGNEYSREDMEKAFNEGIELTYNNRDGMNPPDFNKFIESLKK